MEKGPQLHQGKEATLPDKANLQLNGIKIQIPSSTLNYLTSDIEIKINIFILIYFKSD